ncbi:hypothetical protein RSOLAG22IIIB_13526 [Rhizoctonia solani]|uniref:Uncharacterized protein n=1 Tax=Rhizoctonia solani TaxID=456999 RepID=A0A0K6FNE7_9AGAM|nr:hypothetical protein RSOLAG22IIIB_13526 [Rhizoctonia solani]
MSRRGLETGSHNEPVSSGNSTASDITSASALCANSLRTWATIVGLNINVDTSIPSHQAFQPLEDLKNLSNRFPAWLGDNHSSKFQYIVPSCNDIATKIRTELAGKPTALQNDVELHLGSLQAVLNACRHMQLLGHHSRRPTEADRRHPLDALFTHICESDNGDNGNLVKYSGEQELKLPQAQFGRFDVEKTRAHGVMYLDVPDFAPYQQSRMKAPATAFYHKGLVDNLQVVHCVAEFKREDDGSNQAMMAMVSGLYQRAVLQMPGQFVFGVLHSEEVFFKVVAGIWQENKIRLYEIGLYSLAEPTEALQLYLVLRGIHRLASSYLQELRSSAQVLSARVRDNPPPTVWYPPRIGSIDEDLSEGQQTTHQGGAITQQETPGQRHAHDRVRSYLETISSLSEFLAVDRPPTPPIDLPSAAAGPIGLTGRTQTKGV